MMMIIPAISIASAYKLSIAMITIDRRIFPPNCWGYPRLPDIVYKSDGLMAIFKLMTSTKFICHSDRQYPIHDTDRRFDLNDICGGLSA